MIEERELVFEEKKLLRNFGRALRARGCKQKTIDLGVFLFEMEVNGEMFSERQDRDCEEFVWQYRDWSARIIWTVTQSEAVYKGTVQAPDLKTFDSDLMLLKLILIG